MAIAVELDTLGLDLETASIGHRRTRVHDQVHQHLVEVTRVDHDGAGSSRQAKLDLDVLADESGQEIAHAVDLLVDVDHARVRNVVDLRRRLGREW